MLRLRWAAAGLRHETPGWRFWRWTFPAGSCRVSGSVRISAAVFHRTRREVRRLGTAKTQASNGAARLAEGPVERYDSLRKKADIYYPAKQFSSKKYVI